MKIQTLLDYPKLLKHLEDGLVSCRAHPVHPWFILNYTPEVQFSKLWDDVTIKTRGLVYNYNTFDVIARPFDKFFNLSELTTPPSGAYRVFDKLDGSLGIGIEPGIIATRGSFESDQAEAAMQIWKDKYSKITWPENFTPLWEIIHPTSRVVVDYGFEDLCLLGVVHIATGMCFYPNDGEYCNWWPGPVAREFADVDYNNPPVRSNAEGFVVVFEDGTRVKIKYDEYVQLHKIVTGLNENTVLEWCKSGQPFDRQIDMLPDELYKWADNLATDYFKRYDDVVQNVTSIYAGRPKGERKEFAFWASQFPEASLLFSLLDGKDITAGVWKIVEKGLK